MMTKRFSPLVVASIIASSTLVALLGSQSQSSAGEVCENIPLVGRRCVWAPIADPNNGGDGDSTADLLPSRPTQNPCLNVNSRTGWQSIAVNRGVSSLASIEGGWSVDTHSYSRVSYLGHQGADAEQLAPYNAYKYDQRFPFGALLMDLPNYGVVWIQKNNDYIVNRNTNFPAGSTLRLRINDADNALGDNAGSLRVCLTKAFD